MIRPRFRTILIVPPIECANLLGSRIMLRLPHRVELLGGPRKMFNRVDYIPAINYTLVVGLEEAVGVGIRWV